MSSNYFPLRFCEKCRTMKREDWMFSEDECLGCHENENPTTRPEREQAGKKSRRIVDGRETLTPGRRVSGQIPLFNDVG